MAVFLAKGSFRREMGMRRHDRDGKEEEKVSDKFDVPHGHSEDEIRKAGGVIDCPVCLRIEILGLRSEILKLSTAMDIAIITFQERLLEMRKSR